MMAIKNFSVKIFIIFMFVCLPVFAKQEDTAENYLTGLTVSRSFAGNYNVLLYFKNETEKSYKVKELGNGSYALILPNVKNLITNNDIIYDNEHSNIKVVLSENRDFTDRNNFYTKINFKTKNDALIHIDAESQKAVKPQVILNNSTDEIKKTKSYNVPDWAWYLPVGILSIICLLLIMKPEDDDRRMFEIKVFKKRKKLFKKNISDSNKLFPWTKKENDEVFQKENPSVKDIIETENNENEKINDIEENTDDEDDIISAETENIIDELVKIIIPEQDLVLMPGVPELPGLDKDSENTKIILKDVKIDLFDAQNYKDENTNKKPVIPEKMSLSERLKKKDMLREADEIIFAEKEAFIDNISPIKDIPKNAEEIYSQDNLKDTNQNFEIQNSEAEIVPNQEEYENLIETFKKTLLVAHKIEDNNAEETPEIIDAFGVSDSVGFSLVKLGNKISLIGNIKLKVFLIKTFEENELKNESLFMEFCTQTPFSSTYSVILNKFKALIKVTDEEISLIEEYE